MATGYDGSIRIDTSIDGKGFNAGLSRISSAMKGLAGKLVSGLAPAALAAMAVVAAIVSIATAILGATVAVLKFSEKLVDTLYKGLSSASAYRDKVVELKGAFDGLKGAFYAAATSLLTALTPALMTIINWLIQAINFVSMFIAALSGQKTVMQYVSGSVNGAADGAGKLAKNTRKAGEAAKGALAAFDQLNVLQMAEDNDAGGGGGGGGNLTLQEIPIDQGILDKAEKIRKVFADVWAWIRQAASDTSAWVVQAWENASAWFQTAWKNIGLWAGQAWDQIVALWQPIGEWIKINVIDPIVGKFSWLIDVVTRCAQQFYEGFIKPIIDWFMKNLWPTIQTVFGYIRSLLSVWIDYWKSVFQIVWDTVVSVFEDILSIVTSIVSGLITVIGGIIEFITGVFTGDWEMAWQGIKDIFTGIWESLSGVVKGVVNIIIDLINGMIRGVAAAINAVIGGLNALKVKIPDWVPIWGGKEWNLNIATVSAPQIPHLATGAVIPPNAEFAAILGDQRNGRNLEAPEGLIRQIIQEEIGNIQADVRVEFGGTMGQFVRMLQPQIAKENVRVGKSLISGGVA